MSEFKPARIQKDYNDFQDGYVNFGEHIFTYKTLHCYQNEDGTHWLKVHSNEAYDLKILD